MKKVLTKNRTQVINKFNKKKFNFRKIFLDHFKAFKVRDLENLHNIIPKKYIPNNLIKSKNSQKPEIYKYLYKIDKAYDLKKKKKTSKFFKTYNKFVKHLSKNVFKETLIYQERPTLRVMFPNNVAVSEFHRDSDSNYNHPVEENNVWVPLTSSLNSNTIWMESKYNKKNYKPVNLNYGQYLIFDSGLKHGNVINKEEKTRLSFDFRVIPYSVWIKMKRKDKKSSYNTKLKFDIGGYYNIIHLKKKSKI